MTPQQNAVLAYMEKNKTITSKEAICLGIYRLSAVIYDLKVFGYPIKTSLQTVETRYGTHSNIAVYYL